MQDDFPYGASLHWFLLFSTSFIHSVGSSPSILQILALCFVMYMSIHVQEHVCISGPLPYSVRGAQVLVFHGPTWCHHSFLHVSAGVCTHVCQSWLLWIK